MDIYSECTSQIVCGVAADKHLQAAHIYLLPVQNPGSKVHGANMGLIWGRQDPGGTHVGPMNIAIWEPSKYLS